MKKYVAIKGYLCLLVTSILSMSAFAQDGRSTEDQSRNYRADSIIYDGAITGLRYGATLTLPNSKGPYPAVILVSGTGMQDRNGTMAGHPMFTEIADHLTRNGFAVLRVDDRGVGRSSGNYSTSTTADFADDVTEAFHYLQKRPEISGGHIGLLGHSEGGMSCAIAAAKEPKIAFIISMAGIAMKGYDALLLQNRDLVNASPISEQDKLRYHEINKLMFTTAYRYADSADLAQHLNSVYAAWKVKDDEWVKNQHIEFDHFRYSIYSYVQQATGKWYRYFIKYDPAPVMAQLKMPILALNGDKDVMVAYQENLANWRSLPAKGRSKNVTTAIIPGVNHLFLPCDKCTPQEYSTIKKPISPEALTKISAWLKEKIGPTLPGKDR